MRPGVIGLALVLSVAAPPLRLWADDAAPAAAPPAVTSSQEPAADRATAEEAWRKDLAQAKKSQSSAKTTGIVTAFAGIGLIVAGDLRAESAGSVNGCTRDGSRIVCETSSEADQANERLDQGRALLVGGIVAGVLSLAFLASSSHQNRTIEELERTGRQNGYKLSLDTIGANGIRLCLSRSF